MQCSCGGNCEAMSGGERRQTTDMNYGSYSRVLTEIAAVNFKVSEKFYYKNQIF